MFEIDETFDALQAWRDWAHEHPFVYDGSFADRLGASVLAAGLVEPMSGDVVAAHELSSGHGNWREGLVARGLNSRLRAVLALIDEASRQRHPSDVRIFATEAVTTLALRLRGRFARFLGSEYGATEAARSGLYPIPHEDLTALTLPSGSFDIVMTNEVLEHVPDIDAALREIARVLKPGGWHIGTHPFYFMSEDGDVRTRIEDGRLAHLKEPEIHGNPVDPSGGSLVFETPGWNILSRAKSAGFSSAHMRFVASQRHGYLTENTGVFVFCACK